MNGNTHAHMQNFMQSGSNNKIKQNQKTEQEIAYIFIYKVYCKKLIITNGPNNNKKKENIAFRK